MSTPDPKSLFKAINNMSTFEVEQYFAKGGDCNVFNAKGRSPLSETLNVMIASSSSSNFFSPSFDDDLDKLNESQIKLRDIGNILIENKADYDGRSYNTSKSIKIMQAVKSRFPRVHENWKSLHERNIIKNSMKESVDMKIDQPRKVRKI